MSGNSSIEWTDATWNPVVGCSKVSEGCRNCYAEVLDKRFNANHKPWTGPNAEHNVRLHPERLDAPMRWKKPRRVFVNSMSDLFHEQVPDEFIAQVFSVMFSAQQHAFQILTKRPQRMLKFMDWYNLQLAELGFTESMVPWPLDNVWLGVSCENQQAADERIPLLLQTPAAVRFLSCEPLLGSVDLTEWFPTDLYVCQKCGDEIDSGDFDLYGHHAYCGGSPDPNGLTDSEIDWVICGGESGPNARPMHRDWARSLRDQCNAAGVAYFFKQWGEFESAGSHNCHCPIRFVELDGTDSSDWTLDRHTSSTAMMAKVGKKKAGRVLDGRTWDEFPAVST